jgi:steroid delta-isomerase-like uncharacterized protein
VPSEVDTVRRFYQVYNEHDLTLWEQVVSPAYVGHVNEQTIPDRDVGKGFVAEILTAFPDIRYEMVDVLHAGHRVAVRWSARATHLGDLLGMPPTKKRVVVIGITIFRVEDGQIQELWDVWDEAGLVRQLEADGPAG